MLAFMPAKPDPWLPTRRSLISRLKNWNDDDSWQDFFDTYSRLLYSVAAKSGFNDAEAQDVVQDTIVSVAKHIPNFQYDPQRGSFKNWLLQIARSRIIDHVRKRQRGPQKENHQPTEVGQTSFLQKLPDPSPDQIDRLWEKEWEQHLFQAALKKVKKQVSAKEFQIFDCAALQQWPVKQIASALRVSEGHIYTAKSRVGALLKDTVQQLKREMD